MTATLTWLGLWLSLSAPAALAREAPAQLATLALEPADFALDPGVRSILEQARVAERSGDLALAARRYRLVLGQSPETVSAVMGLARVLEAGGEPAEAARALATLPYEPDVSMERARLLETLDPPAALALYKRLETLALGSPVPYLRQALLLAGSPASGGEPASPAEAARLFRVYMGLVDSPPEAAALLVVARSLKEHGSFEDAVSLVLEVWERWPALQEDEELRALLDRIGVEQEAARLAVGGAEPLPPALKAEVEAARRMFIDGDAEKALVRLRGVTAIAPRAPETWAALSEVYLATGGVAEAERALVAATALSPDEASWHARLGTLLAERYGGRRHHEAAVALATAAALRPTWSEVHYLLGRVLVESGRFPEATAALQACLEADPAGRYASEASQLLEDLSRDRPAARPLPPPATPGVPDPAREHYNVARVYKSRGEAVRAREELEAAFAVAPDFADAMLLMAAIHLEAGEQEEARGLYSRSLELQPDDPRVHLALGDLERRRGEAAVARAHLERAADAGAPEALYLLADLAAEEGDLAAARLLLDEFFSQSIGGLTHEPAMALSARLEREALRQQVVAVGVTLLAFTVPIALLIRRRWGVTLERLLEREPSAYHDMARLLSAIRHEVLKHNTTLLLPVAERLEEGDFGAALYAGERLFGEPGQPGVIHRFHQYLRELEAVGRRHGVRLNLRVKDPVIAPMYKAMGRLQGLEAAFRRPGGRRMTRVARDLRLLSHVLNHDGYRALGQLVGRIVTVEVGGPFFEGLYGRVAAEPGLAGEAPVAVEIECPEGPVPLRIFAGDLEDVGANLFRNACHAVVEELPLAERRVGVAVVEESDPVTGHETVAIRFRDSAPRTITDAILRGSRVERGLGLAAHILIRHQGTMSVESDPGWAKAVVVRLPRAEPVSEDQEG